MPRLPLEHEWSMLELWPDREVEQLEGKELVQYRELIVFLQARYFEGLEVQEANPIIALLVAVIRCDALKCLIDGLQRGRFFH